MRADANQNFGRLVTPTSTYDPNLLEGSGVRPGNWQFGISVQQEVFPRVSVEAGYHRRNFDSFINPDPVTATSTLTTTFTVADNRAVTPADYNRYSVPVPADPRLPRSGDMSSKTSMTSRPRRSAGPTTSSLVPAITGHRPTTGMVWTCR